MEEMIHLTKEEYNDMKHYKHLYDTDKGRIDIERKATIILVLGVALGAIVMFLINMIFKPLVHMGLL